MDRDLLWMIEHGVGCEVPLAEIHLNGILCKRDRLSFFSLATFTSPFIPCTSPKMSWRGARDRCERPRANGLGGPRGKSVEAKKQLESGQLLRSRCIQQEVK